MSVWGKSAPSQNRLRERVGVPRQTRPLTQAVLTRKCNLKF